MSKWIDISESYPEKAGSYECIIVIGSMVPEELKTVVRFSERMIERKTLNIGDWQRLTHWKRGTEL